MEPFTIQCSTCQSRIRVKSPKMIGKVANCPKCNSLVMITGPRQILVDRPDGQPVDSMAMTKDGLEPDFAALTEDKQTDEGQREADGYRLAPAEVEDKDESATSATPVASWEATPGLDESPLLPSDEWASERSAKLRQYLLIGFLGVSGVVLAVVGFFAFLRWYDSSPGSDGTQVASADEMQPIENSPVNSVDRVVAPENASESSDAQTAGQDADSSDGNAVVEMGDQSQTMANAETVGTDVSASGEDPSANSVDEQSSNIPAELPPSLLADENGDSQPQGQESTPVDPTDQVKESLPNEWLKQFAPMLEWEVVPTLPDTGAPLAPPPITAEDLGLAGASSLDPIAEIDWSEQAEIVLPGFILGNSQPLSQTVNLWTHLSGVPTLVDLDSLRAANRNPNSSPQLGKVTAASVREVVEKLAEQSRLEFDVKQNRFLQFEAMPDEIRDVLPPEIQFDDLLPGEDGQAWLQSALELFFTQPPDAWQWMDGSLSYDSDKVDLMTWFRVVRLLENLRSAEGKTLQLTDYDPQLLQQSLVDPESLKQLDEKITEVSGQARPVGQVLSRVATQAGLHCWLDWPHLGGNGLGPSTTAVVVTYDRSLREILADYAEQFSLVVAIEDRNSLWITSPAAYRQQTKLFVLPSEGRTAEQIKQQIRDYTPLNAEAVGDLRAMATPDSRFIVVRCCRPRLRL